MKFYIRDEFLDTKLVFTLPKASRTNANAKIY